MKRSDWNEQDIAASNFGCKFIKTVYRYGLNSIFLHRNAHKLVVYLRINNEQTTH